MSSMSLNEFIILPFYQKYAIIQNHYDMEPRMINENYIFSIFLEEINEIRVSRMKMPINSGKTFQILNDIFLDL